MLKKCFGFTIKILITFVTIVIAPLKESLQTFLPKTQQFGSEGGGAVAEWSNVLQLREREN